jgi:preprotein translocase subunit SecD
VVALNLVSRSPAWLTSLRASPMYLGLDLRGGVHFMLQVDMQARSTKKAESWPATCAPDARGACATAASSRNGQTVEVRPRRSPLANRQAA